MPPNLSISRRSLLQAGAGGLLVTSLSARAEAATDEPAPASLREFTLTASEFDWALMDGVVVRAWGYNGTMPGPELRVRQGDRVRVTLNNNLPTPTTIHWHGVNVPPEMDGVAGLSQAPVEPGASFTYEFVASPTGTRWYHSHTDPAVQVPMGLYGAFIVEPTVVAEKWDREYTLILGEWDLELTPAVATGKQGPGPGDGTLRGGERGADFFLINGRMHGAISPIRITQGERILLRVIHAGAIPHPIHTHGHSFTLVATDGNVVPLVARLIKDTVLIGPAERYDLVIEGNNPGVWMVHCHIEHHMANGMMTTLWYDGAQPSGPLRNMGPMVMGGPAVVVAPPPVTDTPLSMDPTEVALLDDRFEPRALTVTLGATVSWVNRGRNWHSVAAFDGSFESGKISPGDRYKFKFSSAGTFQYLCKHHAMQGMVGSITVTGE